MFSEQCGNTISPKTRLLMARYEISTPTDVIRAKSVISPNIYFVLMEVTESDRFNI